MACERTAGEPIAMMIIDLVEKVQEWIRMAQLISFSPSLLVWVR